MTIFKRIYKLAYSGAAFLFGLAIGTYCAYTSLRYAIIDRITRK